MRRLTGIVLLCSSLALIAATPTPPPSPNPKPLPSPSAAATPFVSKAPSVIIYPFEQSGELQPHTGEAIAQIFAQAMVTSGNVTVLPVGSGVKRADFLTNARKARADYYIAGYITPVGQGAAVVQQLVSVDSGVIVFSNTAQIYSVPDVASQALNSRQIILQLSGRTADVSTQNTAQATPTPSSKNGAEMSLGGLGGIVQSLFHRGGKNAPESTPTSAPHAKPTRGVLVTRVSGNAAAGDLTAATVALQTAMQSRFDTKLSTVESALVQKQADSVCGASRNNTIAAGSLAIERDGGRYTAHNMNVFTLTMYTCFGAPIYTTTQRNTDLNKAVNAAVAAYDKEHPENG